MDIEKLIFEAERRVKWYVTGIGIHGLTPQIMFNLSTERLCELYNVEPSYFIKPN